MPISAEQFESLDYSGLENLHVYGDLLSLYSLPVHINIAEVERLYREIRSLDERILSVYVSYVLARAGFSASNIIGLDAESEAIHINTTEFEEHDWLEHLDSFEHDEEGYRDEWAMCFESDKKENIQILFVTLLISDIDPITGECGEAEHLLKLFQSLQRDSARICFKIRHSSS